MEHWSRRWHPCVNSLSSPSTTHLLRNSSIRRVCICWSAWLRAYPSECHGCIIGLSFFSGAFMSFTCFSSGEALAYTLRAFVELMDHGIVSWDILEPRFIQTVRILCTSDLLEVYASCSVHMLWMPALYSQMTDIWWFSNNIGAEF